MGRKRKKSIDELNPKTPSGWWRTALGTSFVEWMAVENGVVTDKRLQVECNRELTECKVSRYQFLKVLKSPRQAVAYAQSYMRKHKK